MASFNSVVEEVDRSSDVCEDEDENFIFFSEDRILSIVEEICDIDEIQSLSSRLNISHTVMEHYKQTHSNSLDLRFEILSLWREINNLGDFESCRQLEKILNELGYRFKGSELISSFIKWCTTKMCCHDRVHNHALATLSQFQKRNQVLMTDIQSKFKTWSDDLDLQQNSTNMALFLQLYSPDFLTKEVHFCKMLFNINKSLDHHLPRDALLPTYKYPDVTYCVSKRFTIIRKSVTSFLHERRLMLISEHFPDSVTVSKLSVYLDIPFVKLNTIVNKHKDSVKLTAYYILYTWKQNCPSLKEERHVHQLIKALQKIEYVELSEKLLKDYKSWQLQPIPIKFIDFQIAKRKMFNLGHNSLPGDVPSPNKNPLKALPPPEE